MRFEEETVFAHLQEHVAADRARIGTRAAAVRGKLRPHAGQGEDCFLAT